MELIETHGFPRRDTLGELFESWALSAPSDKKKSCKEV